MSDRPHLLLRADGGPRTGIGHLMRCLALGQAWQDRGGTGVLVSAAIPPALEARFHAEGIERIPMPHEPGSEEDAELVAREAAARQAVVALDGYRFEPGYQTSVTRGARSLLLVADHGRPRPGAVDVLLDQNLDAGPQDYPDLPAAARGLFGPRFALLRREIRAAACDPVERRHPPRRLLVTLGGGNDGDLGEELLEVLSGDPLGLREVTVVAGPAHPSPARLEGRIRDLPLAGSLVYDPTSMVPLIQRADVALAAAGSTCWELACLGLPAVVVAIADNQEPVAAALARRGVALSAGRVGPKSGENATRGLAHLVGDGELFETLRERGMLLVDGEGASRVTRSLLGPLLGAAPNELTLRPATLTDARLLWRWVNDPDVRAASFRSAPIPWLEHRRWLAGRLTDPGTRIYVALDGAGEPVGQIRFEVEGETANVDVSVEPAARGGGLGTGLIRAGCERFFRERGTQRVRARVKVGNRASLGAFRRAGFASLGTGTHRGQTTETFELVKERRHA
ncbi:MAG: UDP-2,4-diacetamido-2,4,6-trideoxy-beta-L-altropyranose hydrolase [Acidobacteriota bacterium]